MDLPVIPSGPLQLKVLGEYDVAVVGGGTSGAAASISAARHGARTPLIEYLHTLGGVGTAGLIGMYWHGVRDGFIREVEEGVGRLGAKVAVVGKAEWWRRKLRRSRADIWFGTLGCGAWLKGNRVGGVVVATPDGRAHNQ
jgi:NADPH-dependent 2,4-dienoyl-CoA reductase/sulfur reductase-like enzyme